MKTFLRPKLQESVLSLLTVADLVLAAKMTAGLVWRLRRVSHSAGADLALWLAWLAVTAASLILPLYLGSSFLLLRDCHPHRQLVLPPDALTRPVLDILGEASSSRPAPAPSNATAPPAPTPPASRPRELLELVLAADLHWPAGALGEQEVEAAVLPVHLLRSGSRLASRLADRYQVRIATQQN